MRISFSPQRRDGALNLKVQGDTLIINGAPADLSQLQASQSLPASAFNSDLIAGASRDTALTVNVVLPYGVDAAQDVLFPADTVVASGLVTLPTGPSQDVASKPAVMIDWSQVIGGPTEPSAYRISKADMWRRMTDDEADILKAVLSETSVRMQEIYAGAPYISSDDELFPTLYAGIQGALSTARADAILAPSEGV